MDDAQAWWTNPNTYSHKDLTRTENTMSEDSISYDEDSGNSLTFALLDEDHAFEHLFATNKVPSTQEAKGVFRQISRSNRRLEAIQRDIQELDQRIRDLEGQKKDLEGQEVEEQRRNRSYQCIVAPIKRIPDEMLGEIFGRLHSVDECFPPSVSLVCSLWRRVILKTPRLWTTIHIFPTADSIELAKLSAIRCGPTLPIRILLYKWCPRGSHSLKLDWLIPYRPRIQKFAISTSSVIYDMDPPVRLPLIDGGSFDGLEELELEVGNDRDWRDLTLSFWNSATKADSLKKLRLINMGLPPAGVGLSLDCLTHLFLLENFGSGAILWNLREILFFLANHPQLQTVELKNSTEDYGAIGGLEFIAGLSESPLPTTPHPSQYPFAESERITLPNLKSLSIDFEKGTNWFLDRLTLPALKHLTLTAAVCWVPSFQDLAERSSFSLETFAMVECTPFHDRFCLVHHSHPMKDLDIKARNKIRQQQVVDVLKSCPTIRQFKAVDSLFLDNYLVESLGAKKDGVSPLGPNLQYLCIGDIRIFSPHDDKFQADGNKILWMLESRQPDGKGEEMCFSSPQSIKFYYLGSPSIPNSGMSREELYKLYNQYQGEAFLTSRHVFL